MADSVQIRRGRKETMPELADGEQGYCRDEKALYIGSEDGNVMLCKAQTLEDVEALQKASEDQGKALETQGQTLASQSESLKQLSEAVNGKLTAKAAAAQSALEADADLSVMVNAFNSLLAAMKAGGLMSE